MEIPSKARYDRCREFAHRFIKDEGICKLPVEPFEIAKAHGWGPITVGYLTNQKGVIRDFITKHIICSKEAGTVGCEGYYRIIYDEHKPSFGRIRWTIMHEIGHIVLGHFRDFDKTKVTCGNLNDAKYRVLEREADAFTSEVLAPKLLLSFIKPKSHQEIQKLCGLSQEAAQYCAEILRTHYNKPSHISHQPMSFLEQFYDFLKQIKAIS